MVDPMLPALLRIAIETTMGTQVQLSGYTIPFVLIIFGTILV